MKTHFFHFFLICLIGFIYQPADAQTTIQASPVKLKDGYSALWLEVDKFETQSLPQSASQKVEEIYKKALKEKNSPNLVKSLIFRTKYQLIQDKDKFPETLKEIEQYTAASPDKVEQSVLHSLIASLYWKYFEADQYRIQKRTVLTDFVPEDIREWSSNIFLQKIKENIDLSIQAAEVLQKTDALSYGEIITPGQSSRNLRSTLYEFLVCQGIDLFSQISNRRILPAGDGRYFPDKNTFSPYRDFIRLPIQAKESDFFNETLKLYQSLLAFQLGQNKANALLITDLDRLAFAYDQSSNPEEYGPSYVEALQSLEKQFRGNEMVVEVLSALAYYYANESYQNPILPLDEDETDDDEMNSYPEASATKPSSAFLQKAFEICRQGIDQYPQYARIGLLKNQLQNLIQSQTKITAEQTVYPGKNLTLKVNYRNINTLTINIYKIKSGILSYRNAWEKQELYKTQGTLVDKKTFFIQNPAPYIQCDTVLYIPVKSLGCYEYVAYAEKDSTETICRQFSVSRLATINRGYDGNMEFLVTDRQSGQPIPGAKINFYKRTTNKNQFISFVTTDENGLVTCKKDKNATHYQATDKDDSSLILSTLPWVSDYERVSEPTETVHLFTDRNIYRPGQTVFFKGIITRPDAKEQKIQPNRSVELTLLDANYKEVSSLQRTSNDFGSFSGEFLLPASGLSGTYTLQTPGGSVRFKVEEYKRPTFDIHFSPVEKTYNFGDSIAVPGNVKTFSGVNMQGGTVKYRILKRSPWFLRIISSEKQIAEGSVTTDENGHFEISFVAEKENQASSGKNICFQYQIETTVTGMNGESQESSTYLFAGNKSLLLDLSQLDKALDKNSLPKPKVAATNLNGNPLSCKGSYEIYKLKELPLGESDWRQYKNSRLVTSGEFVSGEAINLGKLKKEPSGAYRIYFRTKDDQGREISKSKSFLLYAVDDKQPPVPTHEWVIPVKIQCAVGEKASIVYGSSDKEVSVLYEIFKDEKKISVSRFELNNSCRKIEIPYLEEYESGIRVFFTFIKEGVVYSKKVEIRLQQPDKKIRFTMDVFRDKLLPGQKEEWKMTLKDAAEKPVLAEVMAGMYDLSLDKIYKQDWNFNPLFTKPVRGIRSDLGIEFQSFDEFLNFEQKYDPVYDFAFDSFNWFDLNFYSQTLSKGLRSEGSITQALQGKVPGVSASNKIEFSANWGQTGINGSAARVAADQSREGDAIEDSIPLKEEAPSVRQNFAETAFFYPQLRTNAQGETVLSFTVPESNTTWKFRALAHTQDLKYGEIIKEAVSQKKLMVSPNLPRFMRHGDKTSITTNISNLTDETLTGVVSIEFFDPTTEKVQIQAVNSQQNFTVEAGKTVPVSWIFDVPSGIELAACRIVAKTDHFSDGEQHLLPVLSNRMLVTESQPLFVNENENKEFRLAKLTDNTSQSLENYRLSLEFSTNPVWYAVQALPALTVPVNENVIDWFGAYYANTLAAHLANTTPKIKQVIEAWTKQGGTKETLLSNLEKNQELKAVLLEETPWVLESKNESDQKQKLALLFDLNRTANNASTAIQKLKELQTSEGGWTWFKGMRSSSYMTAWILYCFSNLKEMGCIQDSNTIKPMQVRAIQYLDERFQHDFEQLKKSDKNWEKKDYINTSDLEYLFVRSLYLRGIPLTNAKEAYAFYLNIAEKYWTKNTSLYSRAINAMVQVRNGKKATAEAILRSLKEHATTTNEMGLFWANNEASSFGFQTATCVHTFMMRAFKEAGTTSDTDFDKMKLWLLKQKQTQEWENVPATVNSIAVLLQTGKNWLESKGDVQIKLGNSPVETSGGEIGTGYFKKTWQTTQIKPEMGKISIAKQDAGPAWGSLYWQYFEDLDKITRSKTGLNVEKKLFVERISPAGKTLEAVTGAHPLKTGEKVIIRLTVRNDRDMEYVMIKDMRAPCFEPAEQLSGLKWKDRAIYYQTTKDASTNFYFESLPKGTYVFDYPVFVNRDGNYSNGTTTIQCLYAPEFISHTAGERVQVEK